MELRIEDTTKIGDSIFTSSKVRVYPAPKATVAAMREWMAQHPAGSVEIIHYDAVNPHNISLAGADNELRLRLPYDELWFGVLAAAAGLVLMLTGKLRVKSRESNVQTAS